VSYLIAFWAFVAGVAFSVVRRRLPNMPPILVLLTSVAWPVIAVVWLFAYGFGDDLFAEDAADGR
jgi:hypothetical protein